MPYANIDAALSEESVAEIARLIAEIEKRLPFLVLLTPDERKKLFKMGDRSVLFVEEALLAARSYPAALPPAINTAAFEKDVELARKLSEVELLLTTLLTKVGDTRMAVGSESISAATQVYQQFKTTGRSEPGLKSVVERLGERWKQIRLKPKPDAPAS